MENDQDEARMKAREETELKTCTACREQKPIVEFYKHGNGRRPKCRKCSHGVSEPRTGLADTDTKKECRSCHQVKSRETFRKSHNSKDGLSGYCESCLTEALNTKQQLCLDWNDAHVVAGEHFAKQPQSDVGGVRRKRWYHDLQVIDYPYMKCGDRHKNAYARCVCRCGAKAFRQLGQLINKRAKRCNNCQARHMKGVARRRKGPREGEVKVGDRKGAWEVVEYKRLDGGRIGAGFGVHTKCDCGRRGTTMKNTNFQGLSDDACCGLCKAERNDDWKIKAAGLVPGWKTGYWELLSEAEPKISSNSKRIRRGNFLCTWCGENKKTYELTTALTDRMTEWCAKCNGRNARRHNQYGQVKVGDRVGDWEIIELLGVRKGSGPYFRVIARCEGDYCEGDIQERVLYGLQENAAKYGTTACHLCALQSRAGTEIRVNARSGSKERKCRDCGQWKPQTLDHWKKKNGRPTGTFCKKCSWRRAHQRRMANPVLHIVDNMRNRIAAVCRRFRSGKTASTTELVGCDGPTLLRHIEKQFSSGMHWGNYGSSGPASEDGWWEVDHIEPIASSSLSSLKPGTANFDRELRRVFHYTNCQPMWSSDNRKKSSNYEGVRHYYFK